MKTIFPISIFLSFTFFTQGQTKEIPSRPVKPKSGSSFINAPVSSPEPNLKKSTDSKDSKTNSIVGVRATACVNIPDGDFGRVSKTFPIGFLLGASIKPFRKIPVSIGLDAGYLWTGTSRHNFNLSLPIEGSNSLVRNVEIPFQARFRSSIIPILFHCDFWLPHFKIMPYLSILGGGNIFTTTTRITEESTERILTRDNNDNEIRRQNNALSFAWAGGFGGGLRYDFDGIELDLGLNYLYGGNTSYYEGDDTENWSIEVQDDPADFVDRSAGSDDYVKIDVDKKTSNTNMIQCSIRVIANF